MTQEQELALYRVVFSLPHHQRRLALARKIIEQGGPLTPDYKEYRTSLRLCNQMLDDPRLVRANLPKFVEELNASK